MKRSWLVGSVLAVTLFAYAGCATDGVDVVAQLDAGSDSVEGPPSFVPPTPEAGADGAASLPDPEPELACIGTECPYPYATCPSYGRVGYKCQNNLLTDNANCGACGNECPPDMFGSLHMATRCVQGACARECVPEISLNPEASHYFKDCNGLVDDGCEIDISFDANNCGACGNKCPDGQPCLAGKCGCKSGLTWCDSNGATGCFDLSSNDSRCGSCDNKCAPPADAGPPPKNMEYGCVGSECGKLRCKSGYKQTWADCNNDVELDGCETNTSADPNNCGTCGNKCAPGVPCIADGTSMPRCGCAPNEALCGTGTALTCNDLLTDPANCGVCGRRCPGGTSASAHGAPVCRKGFCDYECEEGWGDCDGNPLNGCETNLMINGANCGACGNRCDTGAGQPCIAGKCHMVECDGGDPVTK
ncbi:MAG: hypothetical protein J0I07_21865 [Myxococcales bacterium]|nr:hypothetical protein [Myxococcales bacterium]